MDGQDASGLQPENIGQFFPVLIPVYFREVAENWLWFVLPGRKTLNYISSRCCKSNFHVTKQVLCQIFEQF